MLALFSILASFQIARADSSFDDYIPCVSVYDFPIDLADWKATDNHYGAIYIYHSVKTNVTKKYNNLFYVEGGDDYASDPYLVKWCTPGINKKHKCSQIVPNERVYVSARGNTYYHDDNSSITQIRVKGSVGWPK